MSCRSTSGGSVSTSLARISTGLSDKEIQHIFHALKREGADLPRPSELDVSAWRDRQQGLLDRARQLSDTKRDELRNKLFRSRSEATPDGSMFYAWRNVEARARQEIAVRSVADAVDLAAAGSQRHLYELDQDGLPARVWYASYGSNLHRDRFLTYIEGGRPEGSTRTYFGCRDRTVPEVDIPIRVPGARPHFALTSRIWNGGIAFIDAQKGETATGLGRAYEVSREQFEDVIAQENGLAAGMCADIPYADVLDTGRVVTGSGPYETLLHIGDHEGAPVLTFTAPFSTRDAIGRVGSVERSGVRMPVLTNKPSPAYVRMIGGGLAETFGMDEVAQADYLRGCPGGDRYTRQELVRILRNNEEPPRASGFVASTPAWLGGSQPNHEYRVTKSATSDTVADWSRRQAEPRGGEDQVRYRLQRARWRDRIEKSSDAKAHGKKVEVAAPVVVAADPQARALFPAVKTYPSVEEQKKGVQRWAEHLKVARRNLAAAQEELAYPESFGRTQEQYEEQKPKLWEHYVDVAHEAQELEAKVAYAKAQTPAKHFADRAFFHWPRVEGELRHKLRVAESKVDSGTAYIEREEARLPDLPKDEAKRVRHEVRLAKRRLATAQRDVAACTDKLVEVAGHVARYEQEERERWSLRQHHQTT